MLRRNRHIEGAYIKITLKRKAKNSFTINIHVNSSDFGVKCTTYKMVLLML
jgi:hypothetical protein